MGFLRKLLFGEASSVGSPASKTINKKITRKVITSLTSYNFDVVGESFYQENIKLLAGGYSREGHNIECLALLILDPENAYDPNAVKVEIEGRQVGHIPKDQAKRVGNQIKDLNLNSVVVDAKITGGWRTNQHDKGHFGVKLKLPKRGDFEIE